MKANLKYAANRTISAGAREMARERELYAQHD